jgi:hypothetical protein
MAKRMQSKKEGILWISDDGRHHRNPYAGSPVNYEKRGWTWAVVVVGRGNSGLVCMSE